MADVPDVPGVPSLTSFATTPVVALAGDLISTAVGFLTQQWGLFFFGIPVLPTNSTVSFDFKQDWIVSDYPVEAGSFMSYDKVQLPFDARLRVTSGPDEVSRIALLNLIQVLTNSSSLLQALSTAITSLTGFTLPSVPLFLFDAVTPEATYTGCTISHYDYRRRSDSGLGMIVMDIWLTQVKQVASTAFQSVISAASAGTVGTGISTPVAAPSSIPSAGS